MCCSREVSAVLAIVSLAIIATIIGCSISWHDALKKRQYYPQFQINGTFSTEPNLHRVHNDSEKNEAVESTVFTWDIDISVSNPNRHYKNYYNDFQVMVYSNDKVLAEYMFQSFTQNAKNTTLLHASLSRNTADFSTLFPAQQYQIRLKTLFHANYFPCTLLVHCDPFDAATTGGAVKPCIARCEDEAYVYRPYW